MNNLNTKTNIVFKDEEHTGADRLMTRKLSDRSDELPSLVIHEWDGTKLRVTEAWDEEIAYSRFSTHYEGRAADITISDLERSKYGRLVQLAVDVGLDWVFFENKLHVHVSVSR